MIPPEQLKALRECFTDRERISTGLGVTLNELYVVPDNLRNLLTLILSENQNLRERVAALEDRIRTF